MKILTRKDLDGVGCAACGSGKPHVHEPMFMHGKCHVHAGTWVVYQEGELTIVCCECEEVIARIKVAAE